MSTDESTQQVLAAVTAALSEPGPDRNALLTSTVTLARTLFTATAASLLLTDTHTGELVFEATSGHGETHLIGTRFPTDRGIAGWVATTGEALIVQDLTDNPVFARDIARQTSYIPDSIMAAPVTHTGTVLGVLEILDPTTPQHTNLTDLELLTLLAAHTGTALHHTTHHHTTTPGPEPRHTHDQTDYQTLTNLIRLFLGWDHTRQTTGYRLMQTLDDALKTTGN